MKRLFMICGLLFSVITFAQAQGGDRKMPTPEERAQRNTEQLTKKLSLTEDQKAKVLAIYTDQNAKMVKVREDNKDNREAMRESMMKLSADSDAKIEALLTDAQKKDYITFKEERKANMGRRGGPGGPGTPPPAPAN